MNLLIKNVNLIDESNNFFGDIYIEKGLIKELGTELNKECETLDGKGLVLMPAFIDTHAHFRDPGFEYKEDIESGSKAAVRGGYTTVTLMPNTKPVCSSKKVLDYVVNKGKEVGLVDLYQTVSITKNLSGEEINHLREFEGNPNVKAITDDGKGVSDSKIMMEAMKIAKENNWIVMSHAESPEFSKVDMRLAENMMTWRDITLAKFVDCRLHMSHVSTKEAMKYIIEGKNDGVKVTCEITPHHLALNNKISNYRVNPPIREEEDVNFLIKAIKMNYVDCIGTDHAPHSKEDKEKGAPGMIGIEQAFSICYTKLVKENHISLNKLSQLMSGNAAKLLNINKGKLQPGFLGDLVLIDLNKKRIFKEEDIVSRSKNTPFNGMEFYGDVVVTIKNGKIVYNGEF
ncbi:dihydroorotase [Clostridium perfringens]|uniref:Dihydroorotase n=2 Tax=Clostridium perfringens TaxID=1502 RepID=A0AAP8XG03_CLOPF|nr:dihydroorotase [Clostridium perfringens]ASY51461.1 dihydroorotase [Clostridium perfringens]AWS25970.1 dihydroorotase [Clostridium perfringens]EDT24456.1 dihydroorotase, multifunctional complex type [Clostridium perfringens B str. ATCC 3626]EDT26044.1 dihydroorotase, multifunctional complex type [Clostridium perfringens CPE str. F4969]EGT0679469.1 dihydroorotase [Clostridium perfringens]